MMKGKTNMAENSRVGLTENNKIRYEKIIQDTSVCTSFYKCLCLYRYLDIHVDLMSITNAKFFNVTFFHEQEFSFLFSIVALIQQFRSIAI